MALHKCNKNCRNANTYQLVLISDMRAIKSSISFIFIIQENSFFMLLISFANLSHKLSLIVTYKVRPMICISCVKSLQMHYNSLNKYCIKYIQVTV